MPHSRSTDEKTWIRMLKLCMSKSGIRHEDDIGPKLGRSKWPTWRAYENIENITKKTKNSSRPVFPVSTYVTEAWTLRILHENEVRLLNAVQKWDASGNPSHSWMWCRKRQFCPTSTLEEDQECRRSCQVPIATEVVCMRVPAQKGWRARHKKKIFREKDAMHGTCLYEYMPVYRLSQFFSNSWA